MAAPTLDEILSSTDPDIDALLQENGGSQDTGDFNFDDHLAAMGALHQQVSGGVSLGETNPDGSLKQDFGLNGPAYSNLHQAPNGKSPLVQPYGLNAPPPPTQPLPSAAGVAYPGTPAQPNVPTSVSGRTNSLESGLDALQAKSSLRPDIRYAGITPPPKPGVQVPPPIPPSPVPTVPLPPLPAPVVPPKTY